MNNLIISYDLNSPGQNYSKVAQAIRSVGSAVKPLESYWYVKSKLDGFAAFDIVDRALDSNDALVVVDATNNSIKRRGLSRDADEHIRKNWSVSASNPLLY